MKALLYIKLTWSLQNGTGVYIRVYKLQGSRDERKYK